MVFMLQHYRFLFTEHHWDNGPPHGTACPLEDLGPLEDGKIRLIETMPTVCGYCGERLEYDTSAGGIVKEGRELPGEWKHLSGDGTCEQLQSEIKSLGLSVSASNSLLETVCGRNAKMYCPTKRCN